jgi:hypothetical protein
VGRLKAIGTQKSAQRAAHGRKPARRRASRRISDADLLRTETLFGMLHQAIGLAPYQPLRYGNREDSAQPTRSARSGQRAAPRRARVK